ncbi:uncharacterized protein Lint-O [Drosophila bipectinata]|uniref:uncharacterized protein Lint-O n=1 Tax=Drosophila bipectinata TaxID=42026 RepID=UPI001C88FA0B|nr:protein FAM193A [Drosophila bipectinata]
MKRTKDEEIASVPAHSTGQQSSAGNNGTDASTPIAGVVATTGPVASTSMASTAAAAAVRTTGRVKKPKQVYDPSDNYVSRNRSSLAAAGTSSVPTIPTTIVTSQPNVQASKDSSDGDSNTSLTGASEQQKQTAIQPPLSPLLVPLMPLTAHLHPQPSAKSQPSAASGNRSFDTCQKCTQSEPKRGSGHKSNFLTCKSCSMKWHFPCLPVVFTNLTTARKKFKCEKCRHCQLCGQKDQNLIICSVCVDAIHPDCHDPPLENLNMDEMDPNWKCSRCQAGSSERPASVSKKSNAGRKKRVSSEPTKGSKTEKMAKLEPKNDESGKEEPPKKEKSKKKESRVDTWMRNLDMDINELNSKESKEKARDEELPMIEKIKNEESKKENEEPRNENPPDEQPKENTAVEEQKEKPAEKEEEEQDKEAEQPEQASPENNEIEIKQEFMSSGEDDEDSDEPHDEDEDRNMDLLLEQLLDQQQHQNDDQAADQAQPLLEFSDDGAEPAIEFPDDGPEPTIEFPEVKTPVRNQEPPNVRSSTPLAPVPSNPLALVRPTLYNPPTLLGDMRNIPVSAWTVDQVVSYVGRHYPQEADAFRCQDIDGASLLLLNRADVLHGFGLKLGRALRVFELVLTLQNGSEDVRLSWHD